MLPVLSITGKMICLGPTAANQGPDWRPLAGGPIDDEGVPQRAPGSAIQTLGPEARLAFSGGDEIEDVPVRRPEQAGWIPGRSITGIHSLSGAALPSGAAGARNSDPGPSVGAKCRAIQLLSGEYIAAWISRLGWARISVLRPVATPTVENRIGDLPVR